MRFGADRYRGWNNIFWQLLQDLGKDGGDVGIGLQSEAELTAAALKSQNHGVCRLWIYCSFERQSRGLSGRNSARVTGSYAAISQAI